jgi:predicted Zn-dependent protease
MADAVTLLKDLVSNALASNLLPTALFLAERLHALDPASEAAVYLLAVALWRNSEPTGAIETLRRPVRQASAHNTRSRQDKPACEVSVRCAWA